MTREALRDAVRRLDMRNLAEFDMDCHEAFDRAAETGAINPLRFFLIKWATHVAIQRWPARAEALTEAQRLAGDPTIENEQGWAWECDPSRIWVLGDMAERVNL
ncbi:hypothetical protein [Streptomyces sp. NPDC058157]|uniref:hypothetical protein n=1 Tax=Streptomyces sp. NPDC058157 TaxID=3346360 RepID=UPI0036EE39FD